MLNLGVVEDVWWVRKMSLIFEIFGQRKEFQFKRVWSFHECRLGKSLFLQETVPHSQRETSA